jgi:hypothetical protein
MSDALTVSVGNSSRAPALTAPFAGHQLSTLGDQDARDDAIEGFVRAMCADRASLTPREIDRQVMRSGVAAVRLGDRRGEATQKTGSAAKA